ncbi:hypothetical protein BHYA_0178g00140 [Botrytis hyacinthi]|uniref:Uncharacterized protein n=1 Tax=Botrytis hyacinthi TaxID=278943 RepID=A0A4Z1GM60_9HELO|nr:hypothetical protein BHYA_0178g00140 [Botrytis hyacinthi]
MSPVERVKSQDSRLKTQDSRLNSPDAQSRQERKRVSVSHFILTATPSDKDPARIQCVASKDYDETNLVL